MSRTKLFFSIIIVIVLSAGGYWGYQTYLAPVPATPTPIASTDVVDVEPEIVSAEGKIIPARDATLALRVAGRIAVVKVKAGETVKAGDLLIQLEDADLKAAVAQAQAAVAVAQANLDQLKAGARIEEITIAEAQYKAAQSAVGQAVAQRDQVKKGATEDLVAAAQARLAQAQAQQKEAQITYDNVIDNIKFLAGGTEEKTRFALNAANENVIAAQKALDQVRAGASEETLRAYNSAVGVTAYQRDAAKAQIELLKAGATPEQIAAAEAQVKQAQAAVTAAQAQLAQTTLTAPFGGVVMSVEAEVGEMATPGAPLIVLADAARWRMKTTDLAETDIGRVHVGQTAQLTLEAFGQQVFSGRVVEIASVAETNRGNVTYAVTIELDPTTAALRWGMTAFVDIDVKP